jgi:hypothetical protein
MLKPQRDDTRTFAIFAMSAGKRDISANRRLFLIDIDDTTAEDADDVFEDAETEEVLEISVAALAGATNPQTMQVTLYIMRQPLKALVDSGSTHNFLHPRVVRCLLCQVDTDAVLEVRL